MALKSHCQWDVPETRGTIKMIAPGAGTETRRTAALKTLFGQNASNPYSAQGRFTEHGPAGRI